MVKKAGRGSQRPFPGLAGGTRGAGKASGASKATRKPFGGLGGGSKGAPSSTSGRNGGRVQPAMAGNGGRQSSVSARFGKASVGR